jgi:hypothetical protein
MSKIKKTQAEKFRFAINDLSKEAYNAGLTFKEFSKVLESLEVAGTEPHYSRTSR